MNFKQIKAIEYKNKQRLLKVFPDLTEDSGIYILTRREDGFKYAYIGQAKHILTRLAQHLRGYQHIDLSLKKHGLCDKENPTGWKIDQIKYPESDLNEKEQMWVKEFANSGYQLRNKTSGSQDSSKKDIADNMRKGYQQGLHNGYEKARKEVAKLFEKNLTYLINGKPTQNKEKALEKFKQFIDLNGE